MLLCSLFQVYINYFILKFNYNESDGKPYFDVITFDVI